MLWGCSKEEPHAPQATIDDLTPSRYRIVAVDGKPEVRGDGHPTIATVIPTVGVAPGVHSLTAECTDLMGIHTVTFTANLAAGKRYRIAATGASLVEMENGH